MKRIVAVFAILLVSLCSFQQQYEQVKKTPHQQLVQPKDTIVRGLSYAGFVKLTPLGSSNNFQPKLWSLWMKGNWDSLNNVIYRNGLNDSYPPAGGFINLDTITLAIGTKLDRYGGLWGRFVAIQGTPFTERALPAASLQSMYYQFEVTRPLPSVDAGKAIPWFNQTGMGMQYMFSSPIQLLIDSQYLKITASIPPAPKLKSATRSSTNVTKPIQRLMKIKAKDGSLHAIALDEAASNPLHELQDKIGAKRFQTIINNNGFRKQAGIVQHYVNAQGMPLFYVEQKANGKQVYKIVSLNESSPGRIVAKLEKTVANN